MSPRTSVFLTDTFGFDATDLMTRGLAHLQDPEVIELARAEGRIILTFDLDFGRLYHRYEHGQIGIIILRLSLPTVNAVNNLLLRWFRDPATANLPLERSLVVIDSNRVRISSGS